MSVKCNLTINRKRQTSEYGLSVIELMMVLAIMGIVLGISGASLIANIPEYSLKSAAREVVSNFQKARIEAVERHMSCRVVFDVNSSRYAMSTTNGVDGVWSTINDNENIFEVSMTNYKGNIDFGSGKASHDATSAQGSLPADSVSYNNNILTFNSRGTCNSGYVYISNGNGGAYAIGTSVTGSIRIYQWNGNDWSE